MELSAAKKGTFLVSLLLMILALLSFFGVLPHFLPGAEYMQNFWLAFASWALLALANYMNGL